LQGPELRKEGKGWKTKGKIMAKITKREESALKAHSKHHTKKHMQFMRRLIKEGKTFTSAHNQAMKKVGK
jgi:hypothetical protein